MIMCAHPCFVRASAVGSTIVSSPRLIRCESMLPSCASSDARYVHSRWLAARIVGILAVALGALAASAAWTVLVGQGAPRLRIVLAARIDGAAHDLSGIGPVTALPNGGVAFVEPQDFRMRVFDASGKQTARVGRQGAGPGEFGVLPGRTPARPELRLGVFSDTIWIYDRAHARVSLFTTDGRFIADRRVSPALPAGAFSFDAMAVGARGAMIGQVMLATTDRAFASVDRSAAMLIARDARPANIATLGPPNEPGGWGVVVPFIEPAYVSFPPDGSRMALGYTRVGTDGNGGIEITIIGVRGDTILSHVHPFKSVPIDRRMLDSAIDARMRPFRARADASAMEDLVRRRAPGAASPYRRMLLGTDYSIWLMSPALSGGREYTVLDQRGRLVGVVVLRNSDAYVASASLAQMWVVEPDGDGIPSLVQYRIQR